MGSESLANKGFQGEVKTKGLIFIYEWWRLVDEFRNFCMCDETEKVYRELEEIIRVC